MQQKKGLDAHLVKKYASTSTICQDGLKYLESEKVWDHLGVMAQFNLANIKTKKVGLAS